MFFDGFDVFDRDALVAIVVVTVIGEYVWVWCMSERERVRCTKEIGVKVRKVCTSTPFLEL